MRERLNAMFRVPHAVVKLNMKNDVCFFRWKKQVTSNLTDSHQNVTLPYKKGGIVSAD